jgi:Mitochondrial carrier protein
MHDESTRSTPIFPKRSRLCIGRFQWCWTVASIAAATTITLTVPVDGFVSLTGCNMRQRFNYCVAPFSCIINNHNYSELRTELYLNKEGVECDDIKIDNTHAPNCFPDLDNPSRHERKQHSLSRRNAILNIGVITATLTFTTSSNIVLAAKAEFDSTTGNLFTPKADMLSGGSDAARGLPISRNRITLRPGQALQSIYETRFVAYLSRFLLNFDPSARAYWVQQGFGDSWEIPLAKVAGTDGDDTVDQRDRSADTAFAEFAQSVEVGLADYFSGPFGSYSSLPAIVAGINAAEPAKSKKSDLVDNQHSFLDYIFGKGKSKNKRKKSDGIPSAKQGILNLYTLLKARYNSLSAKRQLAILFSFVSSPDLQPVNEIFSLLGEVDNATVTAIEIANSIKDLNEVDSRTSSRRGGGYAYEEFPAISIDSPPPLGDKYRNAQLAPIMKPTSRVLRITITDHGEGYDTAPTVTFVQHNGLVIRQCQANAILDREGHVESIFILDPGFGYGGGRKDLPPKVVIEPPTNKKLRDKSIRAAKAFAQLEYKIAGIRIVDGGTGFCATEPPKVSIAPPVEDPDWYLDVQDLPTMRMVPVPKREPLRAVVTEMRFADGNVAYSINGMPDRSNVINDNLIERLVRDPLELLPSNVRPELVLQPRSGKMLYSIPQLAVVPQFVAVMSPRYRAYDPIFGGVGRIPVTKGANALTVSEYARLALSGAVCTVAVRTALNPLELIKTKQQLLYDDELFDYIQSKVHKNKTVTTPTLFPLDESSKLLPPDKVPLSRSSTATLVAPTHQQLTIEKVPAISKANVGTIEMIRSIVELRGPFALFQSADITFLASLVFGSFGFGATELFRRWFTIFFIPDNVGVKSSTSESELVLLFAASVATVLTALAASPFEVLRVRSMGLVKPKKWTEVLEDFLVRLLSYAACCDFCCPNAHGLSCNLQIGREDFNCETFNTWKS